MMYNSKLAAAIKVNNRVLKEYGDTVYIPFGSEYSILIKNLNSTRAVVNIFLDGENVVPNGLVVDAGREVNLERWIKNGNLSEGNRFKFIERTESIENGPRGIKLEDGVIRIEYQFELPPISISSMPTWQQNNILRGLDGYSISGSISTNSNWPKNTTLASGSSYVSPTGGMGSAQTLSYVNDTGITVPGSKSNQQFSTVYTGALESTKHSMVFKLLGDLGNNKPITKPVTVKAKPKCITCGKQNKAHAKFCVECGTALEIFA